MCIRDSFLPYVAAAYVRLTGDAGVLLARVPYLRDVPCLLYTSRCV